MLRSMGHCLAQFAACWVGCASFSHFLPPCLQILTFPSLTVGCKKIYGEINVRYSPLSVCQSKV
jgi:hypothetical protein